MYCIYVGVNAIAHILFATSMISLSVFAGVLIDRNHYFYQCTGTGLK